MARVALVGLPLAAWSADPLIEHVVAATVAASEHRAGSRGDMLRQTETTAHYPTTAAPRVPLLLTRGRTAVPVARSPDCAIDANKPPFASYHHGD